MSQQSNTLTQACQPQSPQEPPQIPHRREMSSFKQKLEQALIESEQHPQNKHSNGIFRISKDELAVNSFLLGRTLNLKPNTINRNLRNNHFKAVSKGRVQLAGCPDSKNWRIFVIDQNMFNRNNEEQNHVNQEEEMNKESSLAKESHSDENQNDHLYEPIGENQNIYININTEENSGNFFKSNFEGNQDDFSDFDIGENLEYFSDFDIGENAEYLDDDFYTYISYI